MLQQNVWEASQGGHNAYGHNATLTAQDQIHRPVQRKESSSQNGVEVQSVSGAVSMVCNAAMDCKMRTP